MTRKAVRFMFLIKIQADVVCFQSGHRQKVVDEKRQLLFFPVSGQVQFVFRRGGRQCGVAQCEQQFAECVAWIVLIVRDAVGAAVHPVGVAADGDGNECFPVTGEKRFIQRFGLSGFIRSIQFFNHN